MRITAAAAQMQRQRCTCAVQAMSSAVLHAALRVFGAAICGVDAALPACSAAVCACCGCGSGCYLSCCVIVSLPDDDA
jgi:hypothetical protein